VGGGLNQAHAANRRRCDGERGGLGDSAILGNLDLAVARLDDDRADAENRERKDSVMPSNPKLDALYMDSYPFGSRSRGRHTGLQGIFGTQMFFWDFLETAIGRVLDARTIGSLDPPPPPSAQVALGGF
jgi:hypothetical protein